MLQVADKLAYRRFEEFDVNASNDDLPMRQQQVLDFTNGDRYEVRSSILLKTVVQAAQC